MKKVFVFVIGCFMLSGCAGMSVKDSACTAAKLAYTMADIALSKPDNTPEASKYWKDYRDGAAEAIGIGCGELPK